eukprot:822241-Rhodomonas_salina.3
MVQTRHGLLQGRHTLVTLVTAGRASSPRRDTVEGGSSRRRDATVGREYGGGGSSERRGAMAAHVSVTAAEEIREQLYKGGATAAFCRVKGSEEIREQLYMGGATAAFCRYEREDSALVDRQFSPNRGCRHPPYLDPGP